MALNRDDLLIQISSDTKGAVQGLKDVGAALDDIKGHAAGTESALTGFGAAALKINEGMELLTRTAEALQKVWESTVGQFNESQDTLKKLGASLAIMGEKNLPLAVAQFEAFAEDLSHTTAVSKDAALGLLQVATAAGIGAKQAQQMVKTAADMSAAFGKPLTESFEMLKTSLKGMGRGVAEIAPELNGMDQASLKSGKAIDYISQRLDGFANESLKTAAGKAQFFKNQMQEAFEGIGGAIAGGLDLGDSADGFVNNVKRLTDTMKALEPIVEGLVRGFKQFLITLTDLVIAGVQASIAPFQHLYATVKDLWALVSKGDTSFSNLKDTITETHTVISESFKDIGKTFTDTTGHASDLDKVLGEMGKKYSGKGGKASFVSEDQRKAIEDVQKLLFDMGKRLAEVGATEAQKLHIGTLEQMHQVDLMKQKLALQGTLTPALARQLEGAKQLAQVTERAQLHEAQANAVEAVGKQINENNKYLKNFGETQQAIINNQLQADLADIDRMEAKAQKEGTITDQMREQFQILRDQAGERAKGQQQQIGKTQLFAPEDVSKLTAALGPSAGGFAASVSSMAAVPLGMMTAANMFLDAAQKVVDFLPAFIDKVSKLLNSITDLPLKLADSIQNLFNAIVRAVSSFIPNLFKMVEKILDGITGLIEKLPTAVISVIDKLPTMIMHLADKIPALVQRIITALIAGAPRLMASLINLVIRGIPAIIRDVIAQLPVLLRAIRDGIVNGIKESVEAIIGVFKGWKPLDMGSVGDTLKSFGDNVQKQSSKLFEVIDANAASAGNSTAKQISSAIDGAINRAVNLLRQLWNALRDLWLWVWNTIIQPFINLLTSAWQWVLKNIVQPIADVVQKAWQWVIDHVYTPLANAVSSAFNWVVTNVIGPLISIGQRGFQWVMDNIITPLNTIGQKAFQWVVDHVISPLASIGQAGWQWVLDKVVSPLSNIGQSAWQWVYNNIVLKLQAPMGWLSDFANYINTLFRTPGWIQPFKDIVDKLSSINLGSITGGGGGGGGGGGFIQQLGSSIGFAQGGMIYAAGGAFQRRGNDSIPAMYEPGEFVVRRRAVDAVGSGVLGAINRTGEVPQQPQQHITIGKMTIENHGEKVDENLVRQKILPTLFKELKKESARGAFVMSQRGLRNV